MRRVKKRKRGREREGGGNRRQRIDDDRTLSAAACVFSVFSSRLVQVGDAAAVGATGPGTVRVPFDRHPLTVPPFNYRALWSCLCKSTCACKKVQAALRHSVCDDHPPATRPDPPPIPFSGPQHERKKEEEQRRLHGISSKRDQADC